MATIYEAYDIMLERPVALKLLRPQVGKMPEFVERFLNEARSMAKLRGPHVTRVLDCGGIQHYSELDLPYIVLELLDGVDLWTALQQSVRLSPPLTARYMLDACEGLAEAHALGIIHRDIKPENLFLARQSDGTELIKLLDFGISVQPDERGLRQQKQASDFSGSPLYMSPEQMHALPADTRADIWGIGVVMFECLTGQAVFGGATVDEIKDQVLNKPLPNLRLMVPDLHESFACIVERCLERNPDHRFQNVAELADVLEPLATPRSNSAAVRISRSLGIRRSEPTSKLSENPPIQGRRVAASPVRRLISRRQARWGGGLLVFASIAGVLGYSGHKHSVTLASVISATRHNAASFFGTASR
jgi:serine/threonine protein kinase